MANTVRTHSDALAVLHAAAPGAQIRVHEYPRTKHQPPRNSERLVEVEPRTFGSGTGIVAMTYALPFDADEFTAYVQRRINDALLQRQGRDAGGETFMADGTGGLEQRSSYAVGGWSR